MYHTRANKENLFVQVHLVKILVLIEQQLLMKPPHVPASQLANSLKKTGMPSSNAAIYTPGN